MTPALLHVCRDASIFMLRYYKLCFTSFLVGPIYFNWASDTLFFKTERDLRSFFQLKQYDKSRNIVSLKKRGEQIRELGRIVQNMLVIPDLFFRSFII